MDGFSALNVVPSHPQLSVTDLEELNGVILHAVAHSMHTVMITDLTGIIQYVNPRFTFLTGYSYDEAINSNPSILQSGNTPLDTYKELWRHLRAGKSWQGEVQNRRKDGTNYWALLTVSPVCNDEGVTTNYLGIEEDISSKKKLESDLNKTVEKLTHTLDELKHFTAMVSHDLRAPLSTIIYSLDLLKKGSALSPENLIGIAESTAKRMGVLIHELLQYAELEDGKFTFETVQLNEAADTALSNIESAVGQTGAIITFDPMPEVQGSKILLTTLFQNLFDNSLKYCDEKPILHVTSEIEGERLLISVIDNGIGIKPQDAEDIFLPFKRINHYPKQYPGTGLGLSLCKKIVELHGGSIGIKANSAKGATVWFSIPNSK